MTMSKQFHLHLTTRHFYRAFICLILATVTTAQLLAAPQATGNNPKGNLLVNGNFEGGFLYLDGCGHVGVGWSCFTNNGQTNYGFYDDQWPPVVAKGDHSQLIEINTKNLGV